MGETIYFINNFKVEKVIFSRLSDNEFLNDLCTKKIMYAVVFNNLRICSKIILYYQNVNKMDFF